MKISNSFKQFRNNDEVVSHSKYKGKIASILIMIRWSFLGLNWPNSCLPAPLFPWVYRSISQAAKSRFQAINKSITRPIQKSVFIRFKTKFPVFLIIKGKSSLLCLFKIILGGKLRISKNKLYVWFPNHNPKKSFLKHSYLFHHFAQDYH